MKTLFKTIIAGAIGAITLAATSSAFASYKPDYCGIDHDHRSHNAKYYDYYDHDKYFRAGQYRSSGKNSGVSFSITFGDGYYDDGRHADRRRSDRRYDDRRRSDRRYDDRRDYRRGKNHGYRGRDGRIVNRQVFDTRHRARIILIEEVVRTRRGPRLVCTVEARGREAEYVSKRRMRRIADNNCSPRARIKVYA